MIIQIDFDNKIIKVEPNTKLGLIVDKVKVILPNNIWEDYTIDTFLSISHAHPSVYRVINTDAIGYWGTPTVTCKGNTCTKNITTYSF